MKPSRFLAYATLIIVVAGGAIWYIINDYYDTKAARQSQKADIVMYKNEGCQCCDKWAYYMQGKGYSVKTVTSRVLSQVKAEQEIPQNMGACHTALIGDYVVEGHVPVEDVKRLLREQPDAKGIVVPGMPASSPGMNTALNEPFKVYLLKNDGSTELFAQH
ncbi:hypothetical protein LX73_0776 [Fodinibius salinus]|uniref:Metal-binding protein n=1 Tax=Fodinibius salinus TaxID=860790 RepID=A0A5D3YSD8_9BACT|nr:DUF411 domain-containing protein [Fodinibius salinus]TYP95471.1 hypothetical protein LX73_0776 [Fodinibius salinus]